MKVIRKYINNLLFSTAKTSQKQIYELIWFVIFVIQVMHACFYAFYGIYPLLLMGGICLLILMCIYKIIVKGYYITATVLLYGMIFIYEIYSCMCIGWNLGFTYYLLIIIPLMFYSLHMNVNNINNNIVVGVITTGISSISLISAKAISKEIGLLWHKPTENITTTLYVFNSITSYIIICILSILIIVKIRILKEKWKHKTQRLSTLADLDPLTSLLNRRSMLKFMREAMSEFSIKGSEYSVILCDIDDFKKINDTYGHACGDTVLIQIADIFKSHLESSCHISRWGGEELLILAPFNVEQSIKAIEQLRQVMEQTQFVYRNEVVNVTMTFGIKSFEGDMDIYQLIQFADDNMYKGKQRGKNCVICE